jgi:hypothetical protein
MYHGENGTALMGRPKKPAKTSPVRLTDEALKWARIASGYTGEAMSEYVSRIVIERGTQDADRLHAEVKGEPKSRRSGG